MPQINQRLRIDGTNLFLEKSEPTRREFDWSFCKTLYGLMTSIPRIKPTVIGAGIALYKDGIDVSSGQV